MAKDGKCRRNTGELQIQCDKCSRWAFLEETDFQSLQEADSGEFVYLCVTRSAFQEELEVVRAETVALRELVQHLQRQLRDLTTQFERGHSGFDSDQPNAHTDPLSESALTAVGDKTKGTGRELTQKRVRWSRKSTGPQPRSRWIRGLFLRQDLAPSGDIGSHSFALRHRKPAQPMVANPIWSAINVIYVNGAACTVHGASANSAHGREGPAKYPAP
ncbi:hypothetical protein HPB50_028691 [Hyalomma asiaticum]|nr:hypothetical protein HPB50_028691 [Hyalomma asiaticum]